MKILSAKYLKISASVISQPLATILNLSISSGIYPDDLKKAKVTPIFKKGEKHNINNYRPVSVLPVITGIFERHISTCLINFLDKHKLIYDNQSGFRRNHSCQTSLTKMVDNWFTAMNNNEIVGAVLLDLSKAFDLVNHQILKQKLSAYKFSHLSLRWFDSYLSNRFQQAQISGKLSESKEIKAGVPQGSVLGPLLYPRHLCRRVYSFRLSVRPFVRLYVRLFVRSYFRHVCRICVKVLHQSFSSSVYLSNYLSESIHIWTIVTLEGWHSLHDPGPQGPCPGVGLEVKI